jgi:hypothetical protein
MKSFFSRLHNNVLDNQHLATRKNCRLAIVTWIVPNYHGRGRTLGKLAPTYLLRAHTTLKKSTGATSLTPVGTDRRQASLMPNQSFGPRRSERQPDRAVHTHSTASPYAPVRRGDANPLMPARPERHQTGSRRSQSPSTAAIPRSVEQQRRCVRPAPRQTRVKPGGGSHARRSHARLPGLGGRLTPVRNWQGFCRPRGLHAVRQVTGTAPMGNKMSGFVLFCRSRPLPS